MCCVFTTCNSFLRAGSVSGKLLISRFIRSSKRVTSTDGRLTGQSALILGRGPEVSSVVAQSVECYKRCFSWGSKGLVHLKMTCSLLKHDSTTQLKNGATQLSLPRYWPVNCRSAVLFQSSHEYVLRHSCSVRGVCLSLRAKEETLWLAKLARSSHEAPQMAHPGVSRPRSRNQQTLLQPNTGFDPAHADAAGAVFSPPGPTQVWSRFGLIVQSFRQCFGTPLICLELLGRKQVSRNSMSKFGIRD